MKGSMDTLNKNIIMISGRVRQKIIKNKYTQIKKNIL